MLCGVAACPRIRIATLPGSASVAKNSTKESSTAVTISQATRRITKIVIAAPPPAPCRRPSRPDEPVANVRGMRGGIAKFRRAPPAAAGGAQSHLAARGQLEHRGLGVADPFRRPGETDLDRAGLCWPAPGKAPGRV